MAKIRHDIYRDWLAVEMGADTEVATGTRQNRVDVLQSRSPALLYEVKYLPGGASYLIKGACGQLGSYQRQLGFEGDVGFLFVLSSDRLKRNSELAAIAAHRENGDLKGFSVRTVVERATFPDQYDVAGVSVPCTTQALLEHCQSIKRDWSMAHYLAPAHEAFLMAIADAYLYLAGRGRVISVNLAEADVPGGAGIMAMVHSTTGPLPLPLRAACNAWRRRTHHEWVSLPTLVGVSRY